MVPCAFCPAEAAGDGETSRPRVSPVWYEIGVLGRTESTTPVRPGDGSDAPAGELEAKARIAARTLDREGEAVWRGDGVVVASLATARLQRTAPIVQAEPWDLVIVDEAHRVKRRGSASWKLIDGLRSRFLLLLTATPIETELEELYQLVTLLKPGQFATPAAFRRRFVDPASPTSPKNREALRELL